MSRNSGKKRGAQPRPSAGNGGGGKRWPVFVAGLLFGLLIAGAIYLLKILPTGMELQKRDLACEHADDKAANAGNADDTAVAGKKPVTFDFYNMLTKPQVVAPVNGRTATTATPVPAPTPTAAPAVAQPAPAVVAPVATAPAVAPAPATTLAPPPVAAAGKPAVPEKPVAKDSGHYALQAGSFATRAEADRRRGELLLSGLDVNVQQATTDKGDVRYRIMVGPFADEAAMKKARQQLAGMKVDTLPVRLK